jgi:cytochrome c biogenesis protein CcmG/thiol:disulfide interchange protein DsbE
MRRIFYLLPLALFLVLVTYFSVSLRPGHDIHELPSAMIEKPAPGFDLAGLADTRPLALAALKGHPFVINFFASWCIPCVQEAPVLMALKRQGTSIWGIAYKDKTEATGVFLQQNGDPYARIARDEPGNTAIDFGLYGVPESYVIDKSGTVRWRWAGGLSEDILRQSLGPLLQSLA